MNQKGGGIIDTFHCKTEICFGKNALERLKQCRAERALIVTDEFFAQNGLAASIGGRLPNARVEIFDRVKPDPSLALAAEGVKLLQGFAPDMVIALGGGSAIDCAKAMIYFYDQPVIFAAIPTTSGTGSEVTSFSILTHDGVKHPLVDQKLLPQLAILDEDLLQKLPKGLIADAGMDVLAHCLEAICAKNGNPITAALASEAFAEVLQKLPLSYEGDETVRGDVHLAATMAGLAFDHAGLGICHALSHALGGEFHTPHGRLNGILLPAVMEFNAEACAAAYRRLAVRCGLLGATDALTVKALIRALIQLRKKLGLPRSLQEVGIDIKPKLHQIAIAAEQDPCCVTNPRSATAAQLEKILLAVAT